MVSRVHRDLSTEDIARAADVFHAWRGEKDTAEYADVPGFCCSVTDDEIAEHNHVLTPGRYVGAEDAEEDDEPLPDKIRRLTKELEDAFAESERLQTRVREALGSLDV